MYKTLLVPLDGSPFSEASLDQLPHLAGPETEILLLRVAESAPGVLPPIAVAPYPPADVDALLAAARRVFEVRIGTMRRDVRKARGDDA